MESNEKYTADSSPFAAAVAAEISAKDSKEEAEAPSYADMFTEEELLAINEYSKKINISDTSAVLTYGSGAQKKISDFSDTALEGIRTKDLGETGEMITNLLTELKDINGDEEKKGFLGLFRKTKNKINSMKAKYAKAEESVDAIVENLEKHQIALLKDIAVFDNLYDMNLEYLKELTMYIAAGKIKLERERSSTLPQIAEYAKKTGNPEDAQAARDYEDMCTRFERRLHDLELTRAVAIQTAPQIRLLQNNDTVMSEKIQTVIMNTVPLWKSQMVIALGIAHASEALDSQRRVTDATNELLRQNAAKLHSATVDIAKESERGVVDIETLTAANEELIATLDEVKQIQSEAGEKRRAAQAELSRIESQLKEKLLEIGNVKNS